MKNQKWMFDSAMVLVQELLDKLEPRIFFEPQIDGFDGVGVNIGRDINDAYDNVDMIFFEITQENNEPFIMQVNDRYVIMIPLIDRAILDSEGGINFSEFMTRIDSSEEVIVHEFTHYLDQVNTNAPPEATWEEYVNSDEEVLAFYNQALAVLFDEARDDERAKKIFAKPFDEFYDFVRTKVFPRAHRGMDWLGELTPENHDMIKKRLEVVHKQFV